MLRLAPRNALVLILAVGIALSLLVVAAVNRTRARSRRNVPIRIIANGNGGHERLDGPSAVIIRNLAEWTALQVEHPIINQSEPAPDFGTEMLVMIHAGETPSSGYSVIVTSAIDTDVKIELRVKLAPPTGIVLPVISYPSTVIAIPRSGKAVSLR